MMKSQKSFTASRRGITVLGLAVLAGACSDITPPTNADAGLRVVNASGSPIDITIDGIAAAQGLAASGVSRTFALSSGAHQMKLKSAGHDSVSITVQPSSGKILTTVAFTGAASAIFAAVLPDTGSVVPAGKSKLRVSHYAPATAVEFWRTQPDFPTPVHIMTPFPYQATSPYLQSDAGNWEVFVTAPGSTVKLATTGAVNVPAGERRTVVLVDSAGVLRLRVTPE